ncbi:MAG: hypothetical protein JWM19_846 [Actinomycetia bacterium]|nr:hypothetical protein [Actinomycetes bacterium]
MISDETLRKIEQARDLLTEVREELKEYGASMPQSGGWADPRLFEIREQVSEQQSAVGAVNHALSAVPLALVEVKAIWERLGKPEAAIPPPVDEEDLARFRESLASRAEGTNPPTPPGGTDD